MRSELVAMRHIRIALRMVVQRQGTLGQLILQGLSAFDEIVSLFYLPILYISSSSLRIIILVN